MLRAVRCSAIVISAALALAGCKRFPSPVAGVPRPVAAPVAATQNDLDRYAYNRGPAVIVAAPSPPAPATVVVPVYAGPIGPRPVPVMLDPSYRLDAGDKLRIVVYGQDGLTNSYAVDVDGMVTMPLIGAVGARGLTPADLAASITARLRGGYIREPYVAVEVEAYRPFFILGEVAAPGQYPYVPNITVERAVAIAGGFSPRAKRSAVQLTRTNEAGSARAIVPLETPLKPGDSIVVNERWF